jgi:hypothetical protein
LLVFIIEQAGTDAERQPSPADNGDQPARTVEPSRIGSSGAPYAGDLNHVVHDREPDKAVIFRPLRLRIHRLERRGRVGAVEPGRVVNVEPNY